MDSIRISIVQTDIVWENKQENLRLLHEKLQSLCGTTEIVVLPEMFSTGFSMQSNMLAETNSGETIATLKQWASLFQVAICGSYYCRQRTILQSRLLSDAGRRRILL
jgi:omega-amidase